MVGFKYEIAESLLGGAFWCKIRKFAKNGIKKAALF